MNSDFEYLFNLVSTFFSRKRIQKQLDILNEYEISGWEIWLQIEFAYFLSEQNPTIEWWREQLLEYDYRMEKEKCFLKPDFLIRKSGWKKETYIALELKQHSIAGSCINNMMSDVKKIYKVRQSELDIRNFWVLGITKMEEIQEKKELLSKILKSANNNDIRLNEKCIEIHRIHNTSYAYMLF